jgi:hypothetical protein
MGIFDFLRRAVRAVLPERTIADVTVQGLCDMPEGSLMVMIHHASLEEIEQLLRSLRQAKDLEDARRTADKANQDLHIQNVLKLARAIRAATERWAELRVQLKEAQQRETGRKVQLREAQQREAMRKAA